MEQGIRYVYQAEHRLSLYVFLPEEVRPKEQRAAIVFFFGGGFKVGGPEQFVKQAEHFASRGMVAICADYRVSSRFEGVTPMDCAADAMEAIRWVKLHAEALGVDPGRIAASGGSAGGHLALCLALLEPGAEAADSSSEALPAVKPDALVLFNPAVKLTDDYWASQWPSIRSRIASISPMEILKPGMPPTIIFQGTEDTAFSVELMRDFQERMLQLGNSCTLVEFAGMEHGFFNYGRHNNVPFQTTLQAADTFLQQQGYIEA